MSDAEKAIGCLLVQLVSYESDGLKKGRKKDEQLLRGEKRSYPTKAF